MSRIDAVVKRETKYIALFVLLFSVIMEAVFLIVGKWDVPVLLGNLLGGCVAVLNFFLMGLTVQKAVKQDEKDARRSVKASQALRMFLLIVTAGVGYYVSFFNIISVLVPLFFPRIAIALKPLVDRDFKRELKEEKEKTKNNGGKGE